MTRRLWNDVRLALLSQARAAFEPGQTCRKTFELNTNVRFIKILVENGDSGESVSDVKIMATLDG